VAVIGNNITEEQAMHEAEQVLKELQDGNNF
jgi:hypothetical protein